MTRRGDGPNEKRAAVAALSPLLTHCHKRLFNHHHAARDKKAEAAAKADPTLDIELAIVVTEGMLDDGKAEPGAAGMAGAGLVDPIEPLGQPRQMLGAIPSPSSLTANSAIAPCLRHSTVILRPAGV